MTLDAESIANRIWLVRPPRRRRYIANVLVHSLERLAASLALAQRPTPPPDEPVASHVGDDDEDDEPDDEDGDYPSAAELHALEAELEGEDEFEVDELDGFTAANAALETKLTFEGCMTIATAVVEFHAQLVSAHASTDALLHLIETLEEPVVGEEVNFDQLHGDQPRM